MKKKLQTLGLAGILALSGCVPHYQLKEEQEARKQAENRLEQLEGSIDTTLQEMTGFRLRGALNPPKKSFTHTTIDQDILDSFAKNYYGLDAHTRNAYLIQEVLNTNQELKDQEQELNELQTQKTRSQNNYRQETAHLEKQLSRCKEQEPQYIIERHYETQVVEKQPLLITQDQHPVDEQELFLRIGDDYFVFPFAGIVCPSMDSNWRACVDMQEVLDDFKHRSYELPNPQTRQ